MFRCPRAQLLAAVARLEYLKIPCLARKVLGRATDRSLLHQHLPAARLIGST